MGPRQQDLRGGERAGTVLSRDQAGAMSSTISVICDSISVGGLGELSHPLAQADQGLVNDPGQPVSTCWAAQLRTCPGPPLRRDVAQLVTQWCRGGDQD